MAPRRHKSKTWSIDEKVRVLAEASKLSGPELTAYLEREGLLLGEWSNGGLRSTKRAARGSIATTYRSRQGRPTLGARQTRHLDSWTSLRRTRRSSDERTAGGPSITLKASRAPLATGLHGGRILTESCRELAGAAWNRVEWCGRHPRTKSADLHDSVVSVRVSTDS
jgi:hypothetical protein